MEFIMTIIFLLILAYLLFRSIKEKKIFLSLVCVLLMILIFHSSYQRYHALTSLRIFEADQIEITFAKQR